MSTVTNLNRFRKEKARAAQKRAAEENAIKFGRSKAQKQRDEKTAQKDQQHLDGHQREDDT